MSRPARPLLHRLVAVGAGLLLALGTAPVATAAPAAAGGPAVRAVPFPPDWQARREALAERSGVDPSPAGEVLERTRDPRDAACTDTDLDVYVDGLLTGLTPEQVQFLHNSGALDFPIYDALLSGAEGDPRYALREHGRQLRRTFRDAQRFWDVPTGDVQLIGMHGDGVLGDAGRLTGLLTGLYGLSPAQAGPYAEYVVSTVASIPALEGGNNPIFTFGAYAFTGERTSDPVLAARPDLLVIGDGVLDALRAVGIDDVGPRAVLTHEFAHHVQFEAGVFDPPPADPRPTGAEASRRVELMADAFGTYHATHRRGLAMNAKRLLQAERTYYEFGDCSFSDPTHHGTPVQRQRASQWGSSLAEEHRAKGRTLRSLEVAARFEHALPGIVAPGGP
ncbi:hypothetical protein [Kineococcus glutinatus]|uniref:Neutral zinc metallopeptidase n=1 Tax=Kineococcus glutinatus TaxID=1070872 RepID=A0ABP9H3T9_9ACTN